MNIGIYGPSVALWRVEDDFSWISLLKKHFNATIVNTGTPLCSEERILFQLKKTKKLDVAIIVHTKPKFEFIPSWNRDLKTISPDEVFKKIKFDAYKKITNVEDLLNDPGSIRGVSGEECFDDYEEFTQALMLYYKYMVHPDLQRNRFHGALMQIDQYLTAKKIPVVHVVGINTNLPPWFNFTSGVMFESMSVEWTEQYFALRSKSINGLNEEANAALFQDMIPVIEEAIKQRG